MFPSKFSVCALRSRFDSVDLEPLSNGKRFILRAWVRQRVHRLDVRVIAYPKSQWSYPATEEVNDTRHRCRTLSVRFASISSGSFMRVAQPLALAVGPTSRQRALRWRPSWTPGACAGVERPGFSALLRRRAHPPVFPLRVAG